PTWHESIPGQNLVVPATHTPCWHVSFSVHCLPSSHAPSSFAGRPPHTPLMHAAWRHSWFSMPGSMWQSAAVVHPPVPQDEDDDDALDVLGEPPVPPAPAAPPVSVWWTCVAHPA